MKPPPCITVKPTVPTSDLPYPSPTMDVFISWLRASGLDVDTSSAIEPVFTAGSGWGMRARRQVHEGERLLTIPNQLIIRASLIGRLSPYREVLIGLPQCLQPFDLLVLFVAFEKSLGALSAYAPYIDILPTCSESIVGDPAFEEHLLPVKGQACLKEQRADLTAVHTRVNRAWEWITDNVSGDQQKLTPNLMQWAWFCVNSRCVFTENTPHPHVDNVNNDTVSLLPFFDLLNHTSNVKVDCRYVKKTESFDVDATKVFQEGEDVFVCYGPHTSSRLLIEYGFIVRQNTSNALPVTVDLLREFSTDLSLSEERMNVILAADLRSTIYEAQNEPSWSLLALSKLLMLPESELTNPNVVEKHIYSHACFTEDRAVLGMCAKILKLIVGHIQKRRMSIDADVERYLEKSKHKSATYIGECVKGIWEDEERMVQQCIEQVGELVEDIED